MKIVVQKFGGTSVNSPEHRALAANKVIAAKEAGYSPVVVVSAIGRRGAPYATDTLADMLKTIDPSVTPNTREMDLMLACGEIISTAIMAHTLKCMGYDAVALTGGQAGIVTDNEYGNARILRVDAAPIMRHLEHGKIVVVCGFQGTAEQVDGVHGDVTTLGRGGSDTTASAVGAALRAAKVEIFTDVNGVMTADPSVVKAAITLPAISYQEVAEIAHQGAKVLHPRAAEIAMQHSIPLWVKSTYTDEAGTLVTTPEGLEGVERPEITGITHTSGTIVYLRFKIGAIPQKPLVEAGIYRILTQAKTPIYLNCYTPDALAFAVPREKFSLVRSLLDGLIMPVGGGSDELLLLRVGAEGSLTYKTQSDLLQHGDAMSNVREVEISVTENCVLVSVIGRTITQKPGSTAAFLKTLMNNDINVIQTANSDMSLSALVLETDVARSVKVLHQLYVAEQG